MSTKHHTIPPSRRTIVVRSVDSIDLALWRDAWRIDPEALAWVEELGHRKWKNGNYAVTLSLAADRYAALAADAPTGAAVAERVSEMLTSQAWTIIEHDFLRTEIEGIPLIGAQSVFLSSTLVVEWPFTAAFEIKSLVAASHGRLGAIELTRLRPSNDTAVTLAVSLPPEFFDAALKLFHAAHRTVPLSECVRAAIAEAAETEAKTLAGDKPRQDDQIPF